MLKFFSFAFYHSTVTSGSKSVKFAQKYRIFLKFLTLEGTLKPNVNLYGPLQIATAYNSINKDFNLKTFLFLD